MLYQLEFIYVQQKHHCLFCMPMENGVGRLVDVKFFLYRQFPIKSTVSGIRNMKYLLELATALLHVSYGHSGAKVIPASTYKVIANAAT